MDKMYWLEYTLSALQQLIHLIELSTLWTTRAAFWSKWLKSMPYVGPKQLKNHSLWYCTYLYSLYRGVPPTPYPDMIKSALRTHLIFSMPGSSKAITLSDPPPSPFTPPTPQPSCAAAKTHSGSSTLPCYAPSPYRFQPPSCPSTLCYPL